MTNLSFYKIVFVFEIYICVLVFGASMRKRPFFWLRLIGGLVLNVGFALLIGLLPLGSLFASTLTFPVIFAFSLLVLYFSFDRSLSTVTFVAFAAYTVQHFSYELSSFVMSAIAWDRPPIYGVYDSSAFSFASISVHEFFNMWIYFFCFVASNILFYYLFGKKIEKSKDFEVKANATLILVGAGLFIDVLFNSVVVAFGEDKGVVVGLVNNLYNCFCCVLLLYALFTMIDSRRVKKENETLQTLWKRAGEQYNLSKENIELINMKCHDLKHQIRSLDSRMSVSKQAISEIEESIGFYDSFVKTDNEALNVILTEKSIRCHKNGITLSVIADGTSVSFMNEVDVYSLFGNAFDNAIEACLKIPDGEKRVISLSVKKKGSMLSVVVSNSFDGSVRFGADGLPVTSKADVNSHGYGTKSIRSVVTKYEGQLSMKVIGKMFYLNILFPVEKK